MEGECAEGDPAFEDLRKFYSKSSKVYSFVDKCLS